MLVTFQCKESVICIKSVPNMASSQSLHKHKLSPTSVTNLDVVELRRGLNYDLIYAVYIISILLQNIYHSFLKLVSFETGSLG